MNQLRVALIENLLLKHTAWRTDTSERVHALAVIAEWPEATVAIRRVGTSTTDTAFRADIIALLLEACCC